MKPAQQTTNNQTANAQRQPQNPINTASNNSARSQTSTSPIRSASPNAYQPPAYNNRSTSPNQQQRTVSAVPQNSQNRPAPAANTQQRSNPAQPNAQRVAQAPAAPAPAATTATQANQRRRSQRKKQIIKGIITLVLLAVAVVAIIYLSNGSGSSTTHTYYPGGRSSGDEPEPEPTPEPIIEVSSQNEQKQSTKYSNLSDFLPVSFDIREQPGAEKCDFSHAFRFSNTITSTIANTNCLESDAAFEIPSESYLMNCSEVLNPRATFSTIEEFSRILQEIANTGLPSSKCVPLSEEKQQQGFEVQCQSTCNDGSELTLMKYSFENFNMNFENVKVHLFSTGPALVLLEIPYQSKQINHDSQDSSLSQNKIQDNAELAVNYQISKVLGWTQNNSNTEWILQTPLEGMSGITAVTQIQVNDVKIKGMFGVLPNKPVESS